MGDHQGLLVFPNQLADVFHHGDFKPGLNQRGKRTFQNVQPHDVARRVGKGEADKVEGYQAMQQRRERTEQVREVAVRGDGFGHLQERAVTLHRREIRRYRMAGARHELSLASLRMEAQGA